MIKKLICKIKYYYYTNKYADVPIETVEATDDHQLILTFKDNPKLKKIYDMKPIISKYSWMKPLEDINVSCQEFPNAELAARAALKVQPVPWAVCFFTGTTGERRE